MKAKHCHPAKKSSFEVTNLQLSILFALQLRFYIRDLCDIRGKTRR